MSRFPVAALGDRPVPFNAEVAELADAHGSGPCTRKGVGVRVPSSAPIVQSQLLKNETFHYLARGELIQGNTSLALDIISTQEKLGRVR